MSPLGLCSRGEDQKSFKRFGLGSRLRLCLDGWNIGRMENIRRKMGWKTQFSTVWEWEENRGSGKLGRKFSPWAHKYFPPKLGGKARGENCLSAVLR